MPYIIKKIGLYAFILLYLISFVNAASITEELEIGESIALGGRNVTLMDLEAKEDKIIVCINGEKNIIPKIGKTVNKVFIEPRRVTSTYAEIRLKTTESDSCGTECSNTICFEKIIPIEETTTTTTIKKEETTTTTIEKEAIPTGAVVKEESKISVSYFIFLGLILIIGFLVAFRKNSIYSKK
ncbi:hypothetical protein CL621_00150 [archaeon]|nr:hypothetical protein [archaeon]|tara:strand:- start:1159 stop:1707 length:549 start_codon:yes stop_codon:yes gene_type:complete